MPRVEPYAHAADAPEAEYYRGRVVCACCVDGGGAGAAHPRGHLRRQAQPVLRRGCPSSSFVTFGVSSASRVQRLLAVTGSSAHSQCGNSRVHVMQTCHKQYKNAMEMEMHLSSYDHHHTKVRHVGQPVPARHPCRDCCAAIRGVLLQEFKRSLMVSLVAAAARNAAGDSGPHAQRTRAQGAAAPGEGVGAAQCAVSD
jgi:hypothetical protein